MERNIRIAQNSIQESSKSININDDGDINVNSSSSEFAKSQSRISLHGIEIPSSLFPDFWNRKHNQVKIEWPFPLILVVDICGNRDLDLNSARTEIIMSEKWMDLEEKLASQICKKLSELVDVKYWKELKKILLRNNKNEVFKRAIEPI